MVLNLAYSPEGNGALADVRACFEFVGKNERREGSEGRLKRLATRL